MTETVCRRRRAGPPNSPGRCFVTEGRGIGASGPFGKRPLHLHQLSRRPFIRGLTYYALIACWGGGGVALALSFLTSFFWGRYVTLPNLTDRSSSVAGVALLSPRTRVRPRPRWLPFRWRRKAKTPVCRDFSARGFSCGRN